MSKFNYEKLLASISDGLSRCLSAIDYFDSKRIVSKAYDEDEADDFYNDQLKYNFQVVYRQLLLIYDSLGLSQSAELLKHEYSSIPNKTNLEFVSYIDELCSDTYALLSHNYENISNILQISKQSNENIDLEKKALSILKATPKIISDNKLSPQSEADVKNAVYRILSLFFPDTVREMNIPKVAKTYRPDIGITSLKLAIEYKYAVSEQELKNCMDGIIADFGGYANTQDWIKFVAVIYMNEQFLTDEQIEEHFKEAHKPFNWVIIPVYGIGERKSKVKTEDSPVQKIEEPEKK